MVAPLHGDQCVARHVLAGDEPRRRGTVAHASDAKPLALADRVIRESIVVAHVRAFGIDDRPGRSRQIAREEIAKRPLTDEADAGRVALRVRGNALALRDRADIAFQHAAQWKYDRRQLFLRQSMQKIGLVLGAIDRLDELYALRIAGATHARIVTRCDSIGTERARMIEERAELDLAVA